VTGFATWAARVITAAATIGCGIWAAIAVRESWRRAGREIDQAIALVCKPCNGEEGPHTCGRKLPGPGQHQAARWPDEDTGIRGWTDEEIAYLRGELKELPRD